MGRLDRPEPTGPRDPRNLVSYVDVDAPKVWYDIVCFQMCETTFQCLGMLCSSWASLVSPPNMSFLRRFSFPHGWMYMICVRC